ncbi:hypothetical protein [Leptolyngbya sp. PL-A3]|uniref:hypothetical protein n=1 Tax=Leptolyngbya sp. PL-A3 TaxID=2933911 RepID=UPI0032986814
MIEAVHNPVTFDEFIIWYSENSKHCCDLRDGETDKGISVTMQDFTKDSKQPPVHLHLLVSGGKLLISPIKHHTRSFRKERQNYLAEIARRVLSLVGFHPQSNPKILFLQGVDWIILNRIVGEILQSTRACSHKFAHDILQEVSPMR